MLHRKLHRRELWAGRWRRFDTCPVCGATRRILPVSGRRHRALIGADRAAEKRPQTRFEQGVAVVPRMAEQLGWHNKDRRTASRAASARVFEHSFIRIFCDG